jgi:hypothetical protein
LLVLEAAAPDALLDPPVEEATATSPLWLDEPEAEAPVEEAPEDSVEVEKEVEVVPAPVETPAGTVATAGCEVITEGCEVSAVP